jgi:murein hydrolase activator
MRFTAAFVLLALVPAGIAGAVLAQRSPDMAGQKSALREARARAAAAERRSEFLRQEASSAASAADRIVAQRAVLSAEMAAAEAQIDAANARIAIIASRQRQQRARLAQDSEPMLRLNAALQQMTNRPAAMMIAQPGQRDDYVHLRAVMATVQPEIELRTRGLRAQIAAQNEYRAQEVVALKSLADARNRLADRRRALAQLEGRTRGRASALTADAALEFERAIAQGERARDIVGRIDSDRLGQEKAAALATLDGPALRRVSQKRATASPYLLPAQGDLVSGFSELTATGYRERGIRLALPPSRPVVAPAAGRIRFAGRYRSYGQIVIIEHGSGWNTLITNMAALQVAAGQSVGQGAVLGTSGEDGAEIGVELRKKGRVMDIAALLV